MRAFILGVLLATSTIVFAQVERIGLVVPDSPSLSWLSEQMTIGAQLAIERVNFDNTIKVVPLPMDLRFHVDPNGLASAVSESEVDAVVVATTARAANSLRHLPEGWRTPTVIASLAYATASPDRENRNPYVVDLGIPLQHLQENAIRQWLECYDVEKLGILYNKDFDWSKAFVKYTEESVTNTSPLAVAWSDSEPASSHRKAIRKIVEEVGESSRSGIILAGTPWNTADWADFIGIARVNAHIYVGPFASNLYDLQQLASRSDSAVFAASQYLTDPEDPEQREFTDAFLRELGWSSDTPSAHIALQAYDAISVIAASDRNGSIGGFANEHWWQELGMISGIKGEIQVYDDFTLSPPIDLLRVDMDGSVRFSQAGECPR